MEKWKYHRIYLLENSRSIKNLLYLLNALTLQNEKWRLDEVDFLNPLHDIYEQKILSKQEISVLIDQIDTIADLDISVICIDNTVKVNLYCFDCNWVHIYTNDRIIMDLFARYIRDNKLGALDYDEQSDQNT